MAESPPREDDSEGGQEGGVRERLPWKRRLLGEARVWRDGGREGEASRSSSKSYIEEDWSFVILSPCHVLQDI